jgi:hypothetical protein
MLTLNVTNRIIMKITVWLIPTRQRFDNCLLKKFNYTFTKPEAVILFVTADIYEKVKIRRLKCILMMRKQKKISIRITTKKSVFLFEKIFFDNLALKRLVLYVNLLGPYVAYS